MESPAETVGVPDAADCGEANGGYLGGKVMRAETSDCQYMNSTPNSEVSVQSPGRHEAVDAKHRLATF